MKRLTAILLALVYLATTSGIVINTHYCMGEVAEIALGSSNKAQCETCGMENEGCCHDDLQVIKLNENHNYSAVNFELPGVQALAAAHILQNVHFIPTITAQNHVRDHSPPLSVAKNVLHCVYRI